MIFPFDVIVKQSRHTQNTAIQWKKENIMYPYKRKLCQGASVHLSENPLKWAVQRGIKISMVNTFFLSLQLIWKQTAWPWSPDPVKWNSWAARANSESCCCHPAGDASPVGSDSAAPHRMELFQGVCTCWTWYRGKWLWQRRGKGSSIIYEAPLVSSVLGAGADQRRWSCGVEGTFWQPQRKQHTYSDRPRWEQFGRSRGQAAGRHAEREHVSATGGSGWEWHQRRGRKWHHGGAAVQDASPAEASEPSGEQHQHGANG